MQCDVMSGAVLVDIWRHVRRDGCVSDRHSLHVQCRDVRAVLVMQIHRLMAAVT